MTHLFKRTALLFFLLFHCALFADDQAGKVIAASGTVKAVKDGAERVLSRGSPIYPHDRITVGPDSKAELEFTDGGLISLNAQSEYSIDSYSFKSPTQEDQSLSTLSVGGFRALSGSIAKDHPDDYKVKTPNATIGVRGTYFQANIVGKSVFYGCEHGTIALTNGAGTVLIGDGQPNRYAVATSPRRLPQTLSERPPELVNQFPAIVNRGRTLTPSTTATAAPAAVPAAATAAALPFILEARVSYFRCTDPKMRKVYKGGGVNASFIGMIPVASYFQLTGSFSQMVKSTSGHSLNPGCCTSSTEPGLKSNATGPQRTSFITTTVNFGGGPAIPIGDIVQLYLTVGGSYVYARAHNHSNYVNKHMNGNGGGGFAGLGCLFFITPYLVLDLFGDYSYTRVHFHNSKHGATGHSVNTGGVNAGGGIGYAF